MHTPRKGPLSIHVFLTITFAVAKNCLSAGEGQCDVRPDSRFSPGVAKPSLIQTRSTVGQQVLRESGLALQGEAERGVSKSSKFSAAVIVVTGATGYIGSHTILSLLASGYHVVGVDDVPKSHFFVAMQLHLQAKHFNPLNDATFAFYEADIAKNNQFEKILKKEKPAAVMHFAGVAYDGEENPRRYKNNTVYAHKVAEAMTKAGVKILVHSSSCAVYGSPAQLPVTEETPEAPANAYGRSKLEAEAVLKEWERKQNSGKPAEPARLVIMRYFNVIGADPLFRLGELRPALPDTPSANYVGRLTTVLFDVAEGLLPNFVYKSSNYSTQDGTAVRDYVDIMDVVDAHLAVLPSLLTDREVQTVRIYNVASGQPRSIEEVVNMTKAVTGKQIQILPGFGQPSDPPALWADPSKLHREVGWSPRYLDLWGSLHRAWMFRNSSSTKDKLAALEKAKQALHLTSLEITDESGFSVTSSLVEKNAKTILTPDASVLSVVTDTDSGRAVVKKAKKSSSVPSSGSDLHGETDPEERLEPAGEPLLWNHSLMMTEMDLVIPTVGNLGFLEDWREFVQGMHVIIVQDGDPDTQITIPDWVDYELYNRRDINRTLGKDAWIISTADSSIRMFGFLASKKRYILTWDDDVYPCKLYNRKKIDAPWVHYNNLKTNSTPVFLNNYFDPFSMRIGVPTAISHGLWLNSADYDTPTQIMRPPETLTVPRGAIYSMLGRNMAFDRELIGPALMFGLTGDGHPWGHRADMWAGWASKVCVDRLGLSVKTGSPYVNHSKAKLPQTFEEPYESLTLQEKVSYFFQKLRLSDTATRGPVECYTELASHVREEIGQQHPYFRHLADAMEVWINVWTAATNGHLKFQPSRSSPGSAVSLPVPAVGMDFLEARTTETTLKPPGVSCLSHVKLVINSHVTYGKVLTKVFESLKNASFTSWEDVVVIRGGMGRDAAPYVDKYGMTWVDVSLDSYDFNGFYGLHLHLHHHHVCARYAYLYVPDTVGFDKTFPAHFSELITMTRREIRMTARPNSNIFAFGAGMVYAYGSNFDRNLTRKEVQMAELGSPPPPMKSLEVFAERVVIEGNRTADTELVDLYNTGYPRRKYFYPRFGVYKYAQV